METESVRLRARSNSAESWEATNGPAARGGCARHTWQIAEEESGIEDNNKASCKQGNYLQIKLQVGDQSPFFLQLTTRFLQRHITSLTHTFMRHKGRA